MPAVHARRRDRAVPMIGSLFAPPRRMRTVLAALGIFAASLVVGTAATVGFGLATGFDRAARAADLPDVIARFDRESRETVDERVRALPNLAARSYRHEEKNVELRANGQGTRKGVLHIVVGGRRGYAVTEGRDLRGPDEVVVERGLAREWGLAPGDRMEVFRGWQVRIVGVAVEPDNVAFPLTVTPRVYTSEASWDHPVSVNLALLWLADPDRADITLTQARATSFGIGSLAFITRAGVEVLLGQAAGIVISLLVAFSLVALVAAGTMLAASAQAEVQRRLPAFGVRRALGFTPARLAADQAAEAALLAVPAAALGLTAGALAVAGPSAALLAQLNELPPGVALLPVLAACLLAITALVTAAATWPAWRAARRPPAEILRGGDLARPRRRRALRHTRAAPAATSPPPLTRGLRDGLLATGARFALAARGRFAASVATIAVCAGVVTLMLALAALLERLRDDPGTVGKRYELTVRLNPFDVDAVKAIPGVADAAERYQADVADSFRLGEPLRMIAYPGDHTRFEAPPLAEGRRLRSDSEAEVGVGLADALGLRPGATFAVQGEGGTEVRFRVVGVVRALEHDGRIAYVRPPRLLDTQPGTGSTISVRLTRGADRAAVERDLAALGAPPQPVGGATTRNAAFLGVLATVLRGVGLAVGLVCLYALIQALAMTARERRGAVALLRAVGGDARTVAAVLAGAALAVAVPAALAGVLLEWLVLGPLVARLASGFADLPLAPSAGQVALVIGGLLALSAAATTLVARRTMRERVIEGLREE
jgi:ABC-type lipoprotein release transport system permease subunit